MRQTGYRYNKHKLPTLCNGQMCSISRYGTFHIQSIVPLRNNMRRKSIYSRHTEGLGRQEWLGIGNYLFHSESHYKYTTSTDYLDFTLTAYRLPFQYCDILKCDKIIFTDNTQEARRMPERNETSTSLIKERKNQWLSYALLDGLKEHEPSAFM